MQALPQFFGLQSLELLMDKSPLMVMPETLLADAIALIAAQDKNVLVGSGLQVVGCLTKQDVVKIMTSEIDWRAAKISEVMQISLIKLQMSKYQSLTSVLSILQRQQFSLLLVVDDFDLVVGVITPESICQALAQETFADDIIECQQAQKALEKSEERCKLVEESLLRFRKAIESTSDAIAMADIAGESIYVNPAFIELFDYTLEQLQSAGGIAVIFQKYFEYKKILLNIQKGESWRGEITMQTSNGQSVQIDLRVDAIKDTNDKIMGIISIYTDITQRKQAEEGLRLRDRAIAASSNGIIIADVTMPASPIIYVNPAFERMSGYCAAEVIGQNFRLLQNTDINQSGLQELRKAMQEGKDCTVVLCNNHKDGSLCWNELNISPVYDKHGYLTHYIGIQADITVRKQLEQELRIALEKEKELSELKSRFVSMTSHEFRTPLSIILSSCELLEHYRHKWTEEKQLTHLHRIQTAVKRMTEMLNDILVIGKVEAGKLKYRPVSLNLVEYCHQLVEEVQLNRLNQHVICFTSQSDSIQCCMDEKLLGHILSNLLLNAIKYSSTGSTVKFTLVAQNEQAIFEIQDEGIGIPEDDLPHLFESFYRARNVGNILGTGLGLAIVKKCVNVHKGKIFVASKLGLGTKFTVILPLNNSIQCEVNYAKNISN
ncbi:MAG: PAS domain S-box protein [Desmonostoc vinosum HA7617-LM4]|jgi:PAS domain S-box-containing protein|nr:PAS domain S-box protein [Desmonostoc vinosum HA7617-LM4]